MKDEEMAEEYIEKNCKIWEEGELTVDEIVRLAYLAGLKAGKPQWHSPNEHIDKDMVVVGIIKICNKPRYSLVQWNGEWWYQYGSFNAEVRLIAWCEIPTFDKE